MLRPEPSPRKKNQPSHSLHPSSLITVKGAEKAEGGDETTEAHPHLESGKGLRASATQPPASSAPGSLAWRKGSTNILKASFRKKAQK